MTNREFQNIMKNASDKTLGRLSCAAPLTKRDKDRIFRRSMEKLHEKERTFRAADKHSREKMSGNEIMQSVNGGRRAQIKQSKAAHIRNSTLSTVTSIAAALVLALGIAGMLFYSNKSIDTDSSSSSSSSSSTDSKKPVDSMTSSVRDNYVAAAESSDDSQNIQTESETDIGSEVEVIQVTPDDSSDNGNDSTMVIIDDGPSSNTDLSSYEQDVPSDDSSRSDSSEPGASSDTDSQVVDMDDLWTQLNGSIDSLNTQICVAKGGFSDVTVWYDADFNITDNKDELVYYAIPEEYRERYENANMVMNSGHFTRGFISSMGLDDISDRIVENDGTLYFRADKYTAHRAEYYVLLNDVIHMEGDDRFFVYVTEGHGVYELSFVYEPVIAANTSIWKMDSMTFEKSLY